MIRIQRKFDCAFALLVLVGTPAFSQTPQTQPSQPQAPQSIDALRAIAAQFVQRRFSGDAPASTSVVATAAALDARLRLPGCAQSPAAFAPGELRAGARVTVGVRCEKPAWTVYVPVSVETELPVLVLRQAIARNGAVLPQDVEVQRRRVPGIAASYITDAAQLTGRHLKSTSAAGTALTVDLLTSDVLIRRGQRVTLVAAVGGLEVRVQGEALTDAQPDGRIRVTNLTSRRVVEGQVESRDSVRVGL
jgi:flagella basal body P-ring formation protein FlgA